MCGRGVINDTMTWTQVHAFHRGDRQTPKHPIHASYNIAPNDPVPVVCARESTVAHWGLVPGASFPTFNARSETAHEKPTFREAFRERRCVVALSGYYEWSAPKQPHYIRRADEALLLLAGLWSFAKETPTGIACTVLTCTPNQTLAKLHQRMPCVLEPEEVASWLGPAPAEAHRVLLKATPEGVLDHHRVSKRVGNVSADDPSLIEPVAPEPPGLFG